MQAPVVQSLTTTTGGLTLTLSSTRTAALTDANDPLSLTGLTETVTVNGKTSRSVFDAASRTTAYTSAAGRQSASIFDAAGRLTQRRTSEILPVDLAYDAQGRLAAVSQGSGEEKREVVFAYNAAGYLETVTDPLGRAHGYAYDASGRVVREVFADNRETLYSYDANGNLTAIAPPGRPAPSTCFGTRRLMRSQSTSPRM
jgi:YD repeat-containing protein